LSSHDQAFLRKFKLLIEEHLDNDAFSIEDFAAKMLISRSQLHRKLDALTGQSTSEFVRSYRLDRAHAMLKNREGLVGEVALRVGFGNEKYFSTMFRERFGVPPSQILG
jgi:AraC-like DNA-binding protein